MLGLHGSKFFIAAQNLEICDPHFIIPRSKDNKMNEIVRETFEEAIQGYEEVRR
jgi:hypothetical protein